MELALLVWLVCGVVGAVLAQSKNRSPLTGGLVGLLGGPIGVFVLACLSKLGPGEVEGVTRASIGKPVRYLAIGTGVLLAVLVIVGLASGQ